MINLLKWLKSSSTGLITSIIGILAVLTVHFRHAARAARDKLKQVNHARKVEKAQIDAIIDADQKHEEKRSEINSDEYDPRTWFSRHDR